MERNVRPLSRREHEALSTLIDRGVTLGEDPPVTIADRTRWRGQIATTYAGDACRCGTCPSIQLTDASGSTPSSIDDRVVLSGDTRTAALMLFIDKDRLSYLELAPVDDAVPIREFPTADEIRTDVD